MANGTSKSSPGPDWITVHRARQNTLKNITVSFPKGKLTAVTGVSGSGKSSLCFDTLYAEGQRRYVESFSTYARQFLERMDRPDVDAIDGLIPAVAIEQRNTIRSARSTLGSLTELTDHLKVLFRSLGELTCPTCGKLVTPESPGFIATELLKRAPDARMVVTFPFHLGEGVDAEVATRFLQNLGFGRVWLEGETVDLDALPKNAPKRLDLIVDRLVAHPEERARLTEALETAYRNGEQEATTFVIPKSGKGFSRHSTEDRRCCGARYPELREGLFSFNSPLGACEACNGFGRVTAYDMDRVAPDHSLSIRGHAIKPWHNPKRRWERKTMMDWCAEKGIDTEVPFADLTEEQRQYVLMGDPDKKGSPGRRWDKFWPGVQGWFTALERKSYKMHIRILLSRYRAYRPCGDCGGTRFGPQTHQVHVAEQTVAQVLALTVTEARSWVESIDPGPQGPALAPVFSQLRHRLAYLERVGLGYLSLGRQGRTLSGGEIQRANLTSALGSGLVNTLFVLDEPTIGLHPRDTERLADLLSELTRRENTVVLVEHDPDMLRVADHLIDMGPGPGRAGGEVVYQGPPGALMDCEASATQQGLLARSGPRAASRVDLSGARGVVIRGASAQNLKNIDITIPYGQLTVLTGVSGSGKSTLMEEVIYRGARRIGGFVTDPPGACEAIEGLDPIGNVVQVDQSPPASSPRSNPATYMKAWDGVRSLFARQPLSKERGYAAGTFSFNAGKGRCPACEGAGVERVEMQFLSDIFLTCQVCEGQRFRPEVLEVRWEGRSIADMLALSVDEAIDLLGTSAAGRRLGALSRVGLGYLALGQALATLSGGEAQRLKIAHHLSAKRKKNARGDLFLLDEPTTGLHLADVDCLIANLQALADAGNTVLVIEHHLDVMAAADHILELGPEGGEGGGDLIYSGSPARLAAEGSTPTAPHLARWLEGVDPLADAEIRSASVHALGVGETAARYGEMVDDDQTRPAARERIEVVGARVHNLKSVSVDLPRTGRTVISGVSGSGKSSLAFNLIFAEGQRRFLDCLSPYARQYITQLGRPDADRIAGIPPTIAIEQRTTRGGARSNVANITEIEPFLRLIFARLGVAPGERGPVDATVFGSEAAEFFDAKTEILVRAPIIIARKGLHKPVFRKATKLGHTEIVLDGVLRAPKPVPRLRRMVLHTIEMVVGRVKPTAKNRPALVRLIEDAARLSNGPVSISTEDLGLAPLMADISIGDTDSAFAQKTWDPRLFSPHTEVGACPNCKGKGLVEIVDLDGDKDEATCPSCRGTRLGTLGRTIEFEGRTLPSLLALTAPQLMTHLRGLKLGARAAAIAEGPFKGISDRADFLGEVGLNYLSLDRRARSLSGGEAQRIRLAAQLGAHLSGVLYILDEPTIGLHPTDTEVLLQALDRLQNRGNGVLMVEHDEATLRTADLLVDMGPGAGIEGGEILVQGDLETVLADPRSITGRCLANPDERRGREPRPVSLKKDAFITFEGLSHHTLHDIDVQIPRGRLTVVTGVSGSGKSSLMSAVAHALTGHIDAMKLRGGGTWRSASGFEDINRFVTVDDKPIGKNSRSTPATYVKAWDPIRRLFAGLPESRLRGWKPGRFSFNVAAGRCDTCSGQGVVTLEMSFLPDAFMTCEVCAGRRWNHQTRQVQYNGHSIDQVLALSVREALKLFERIPKIQRPLQLLDDVGLGYLSLGQSSPTLSGGEAQRIKLASELVGRKRADALIILDEPTVGLHMADVPRLMAVLDRLVEAGATVVVIEHDPTVIRAADWLIDMGPGPGEAGGQVVYSGPFKGVLKSKESRTGQWFRRQKGKK